MLAAHTFLGVTTTEYGQAALGLLVAVIGWILHHKTHKIEVLVNGRFNKALERIDQLEAAIRANGHAVPPGSLVVDENKPVLERIFGNGGDA